MTRATLVLTCLLLLAAAQAPSALDLSALGTQVCNQLFSVGYGSSSIGQLRPVAGAGNYTELVTVSLLLVMMMMSLLGITYAIGTAFGIESLRRFTKTELLESLFNIIVIIFIAAGLGFADGIVVFFTNLAQIGTSATGATPPSGGTMFQTLCNSYMSQGAGTAINGFLFLLPSYYITETLSYSVIKLMPSGIGFSIKPFNGWYPYTQIFNLQFDVFLLVAGVLGAVAMFMFALYYLFPILLYAGVLLRSFPWTRAAGGSMLSLFIAFYIIFPALLYPFSVQSCSGSAGNPFCTTPAPGAGCTLAGLSSFSSTVGTFIACLTGSLISSEITWFITQISYSALQMFGVIVAFLISFDLLEKLGDVLGAPSVHGRGLLSKVI